MDELDFSAYLRFLFALIFVIGLVFLVAAVAKKYGLTGSMSALSKTGLDGRRLGIQEMFHLDGKRKLVLVRRDGAEHLLLLSQAGDTVVERNIQTETSKPDLRQPQNAAEQESMS